MSYIVILTMLANILIRCSFIAAMCYCANTGHTIFASLSFVGALLGGYSISTQKQEG